MPLATLHLIALSSGKTPSDYVQALKSVSIKPIITARVVRWIIKPEKLAVDNLMKPWDIFIVVPKESPIPETYLNKDWLQHHWTMTVGIPSRITNGFDKKNAELLHPSNVPDLTGSMEKPQMANSTQGLELNDELLQWSKTFKFGGKAVSMLNLLAFKPGMDESYRKYGKAFAETIGSRRGGDAKLVGKVVGDDAGWEEFALAHYPSIQHFVDMIASEDYQSVNHEFRLPSLKDTCILCTTELDPDLGSSQSKL